MMEGFEVLREISEVIKKTSEMTSSGGRESLRPLKFKGTPEQDIDTWLDQFERYAEFSLYNDRRKLACLKTLLTHYASTWLRTQGVHFDTCEDLSAALRAKFSLSHGQRFLKRQELKSTRQKMGESVQSYAQTVARLCMLLNVTNGEHLQVMVQGLLPSIKEHVLCQQPSNIDQALSAAIAKESAMQATYCNPHPHHDYEEHFHRQQYRTEGLSSLAPDVKYAIPAFMAVFVQIIFVFAFCSMMTPFFASTFCV